MAVTDKRAVLTNTTTCGTTLAGGCQTTTVLASCSGQASCDMTLEYIVVAVCRGLVGCRRQRGQLVVLPAQPLSRVVVPHLERLSREPGGSPRG